MSEIKKSDMIRDVLQSIIDVTGRRTFDSYILMTINNVIIKLKKNYAFLNAVKIHDDFYSENHTLITVSNEINTTSFTQIAQAIQQILREVYNHLEDDAGLYFVKEIKEHLGNEYIQLLQSHGVNFDIIQKEQHLLYASKQRKKSTQKQPELLQQQNNDISPKPSKKQKPALDYSWRDVSTWKYNNNVCTLYKSDGSLLDKLELEKIVEKIENPICSQCNKHMKSIGSNQGFRCKICGNKSNDAILKEKPRLISLGWYEAPVCARRHLSKPLKRII